MFLKSKTLYFYWFNAFQNTLSVIADTKPGMTQFKASHVARPNTHRMGALRSGSVPGPQDGAKNPTGATEPRHLFSWASSQRAGSCEFLPTGFFAMGMDGAKKQRWIFARLYGDGKIDRVFG